MSPAQLEADARVLREALSVLGDRLGAGVLVLSRGGTLVFATARATRILGAAPGSAAVPREITTLGERVATGVSDNELAHLTLPGTPHRIAVQATRLRGAARYVLLTLTEEAPRATLTSSLVSHFGLSAREVQLVQLASRGLKNREIGERMRLSEATVKTYLHGIFRELGVRNRAELVSLADRLANDGPGSPPPNLALAGAF
jgi:DNA-binding CsgD family transcriptional regulator